MSSGPGKKIAGILLRAILIASDVPFDAVEGVVPDLIISSLLDLVGAASGETGAA